MLVPKGNISLVKVPSFRRKSWKVEPHESREMKEEIDDPLSDAYINTYHQLLADSAPSWVVSGSSRRPTLVEKDYSSDDSIHSEALFHEPESKDDNSRKKVQTSNPDSETSGKSIVTTSASTEVQHSGIDSSRSTTCSRARGKPLSRSMGFDARNGVVASDASKTISLRRSWAEKKHPSPESSQSKPPALFTRDNPPPPPPRPRRRTFNLCPPPPPPPPSPLKTANTIRRVSSGQSIASRHSSRFNFLDRRQRRVSFQDEHPKMNKQLGNPLTGPSLSGLKNTERRPKRLSISSTSAVAPKDENRPIEEPRIHRPKQLSSSCNDTSFSTGPLKKNSIQESLSSSMPDVLSHIPIKAKTTSFQDHDDVNTSSSSFRRLSELSRSLSRVNINSQEVTSDEEWSDIMSYIEDKNLRGAPRLSKTASFHLEKELDVTPALKARPNRRDINEVVFDENVPKRAAEFHDGRDAALSTYPTSHRPGKGARLHEDSNAASTVLDSEYLEPMPNTIMKKQDTCDSTMIEELPGEVLETKGKTTKEKLLDKIPLMKKVRSHRSGSIDEDVPKEKDSLRLRYDKNGRCVKHPSIIVAKKRPFAKGWDLIKDCCPMCAETEVSHPKMINLGQVNEQPEESSRMKSRRRSRSVSIGVDELLAPSNKTYDWQLTNSFTSTKSNGSNEVMRIEGADSFLAKSNALRSAASLSEAASYAISQGRLVDSPIKSSDRPRQKKRSTRSCSSRQPEDNSVRNGSSRHLDYSARSEGPCASSRHLDYSTRSDSRTRVDYSTRSEAHISTRSSIAIVSKMPYTTPWGEFGWYTGEVDGFGVPNGEGRMRFKSGQQHSGIWTSGYSEQFIENNNRMKRGFGTNVAPWKEHNSEFSSNLMYKM